LGEGLLRSEDSGVSLQRERPSRHGRVMLRNVGSDEPGASYQVEHRKQPGDSLKSDPFQRPSQGGEGWEGVSHSDYGQKPYVIKRDKPMYSGKPPKSTTPEEAEPWGDWGAA